MCESRIESSVSSVGISSERSRWSSSGSEFGTVCVKDATPGFLFESEETKDLTTDRRDTGEAKPELHSESSFDNEAIDMESVFYRKEL